MTRVMDLNARSVITASRVAHAVAEEAAGGFIVNTSSIAARNGAGGGAGLYGSAKSFVSNVTRGMAKELIGDRIRVNAVAPGIIATPFHERYSSAEQMKGMIATIPQGRAGTAEDCVGAYLFLSSRPVLRLHHRPGDRGEWRPAYAVASDLPGVSRSGQAGSKMVDFENRSAAYVWVRQHRKRRKSPFAGRHHLNIDTP